MGEFKDGLKKLGNLAGKQIVKGAKSVVNAVQDSAKNSDRKDQILDKMYPGTIKEFARQKGIRPESYFDDKLTIDDYKDAISDNVSLEELIDFAKKKRIDIRDVTDGIDEDEARKEQKKLEEDANLGDELKEVAKYIREFKPFGDHLREYQFQVQLAQYLKSRFPSTSIESQRGSSRPDIVVNGIAIEIKGPTGERELQTIADKLLRYPQRFPKGVIVTLFSINATSYRYEEWYKGIRKHHPNVEIIKK